MGSRLMHVLLRFVLFGNLSSFFSLIIKQTNSQRIVRLVRSHSVFGSLALALLLVVTDKICSFKVTFFFLFVLFITGKSPACASERLSVLVFFFFSFCSVFVNINKYIYLCVTHLCCCFFFSLLPTTLFLFFLSELLKVSSAHFFCLFTSSNFLRCQFRTKSTKTVSQKSSPECRDAHILDERHTICAPRDAYVWKLPCRVERMSRTDEKDALRSRSCAPVLLIIPTLSRRRRD